ncbi:MAG: DUF29 domain-containing protein [Cyanobacteria bacterium J06626_18]
MEATRPLSSDHPSALYETDYVQWISATVEKLRHHDYAHVDWASLIEEIEDMGKRERRSLKNDLIVLLLHLLKWQYQPTQKTGSCAGSIVEHRRRILEALKDSPSLKPYLASVFAEAYGEGVKQAAAETMLPVDTFPNECEFELKEVMDDGFLPENPRTDR